MEKRLIKEPINDLKEINLEETIFITSKLIFQYLRSLIVYGFKSKITTSNLELLKIYYQNLKEENKYYKAILNNYKNLIGDEDLDALLDYLELIDTWKEDFILYIYNFIDDLNIAFNLNQEYRAQFPKKDFDYLTETDKYRRECIRIILGMSSVIDYFSADFNFPEDFYEYMKNRTIHLDDSHENRMDFIGVYPKIDQNGKVMDIKMYLPYIEDMKTLLITIHEYYHAYQLYLQLDKEFQDIDYEKDAKAAEQKYLEEFFEPTYQRIFKPKNQFT